MRKKEGREEKRGERESRGRELSERKWWTVEGKKETFNKKGRNVIREEEEGNE